MKELKISEQRAPRVRGTMRKSDSVSGTQASHSRGALCGLPWRDSVFPKTQVFVENAIRPTTFADTRLGDRSLPKRACAHWPQKGLQAQAQTLWRQKNKAPKARSSAPRMRAVLVSGTAVGFGRGGSSGGKGSGGNGGNNLRDGGCSKP
jgi:hypothetical protein